MISVEAALAELFALCAPLPAETLPLRQAAGRVLAEAVRAGRDQPPFDASAMDGYAIREADHNAGQKLTVVGEAAAGHGFSGQLKPGEAVRIFTGAPVPAGADRVVLQEDVARAGEVITLGTRLEPGSNVRARGQDFRLGAEIAAPRLLTPTDVALVAAMNIAEVRVARRPVVALIATGDELVMPGNEPSPDQIVASNAFALAAMAEAAGAEVRLLPIAQDRVGALRFAFDMAADVDLIVTIGGASVGDHDLVAEAADGAGMKRAFYKVAMRPGKPLMAGKVGDSVLLGLPGNPVSSIVCGHIFMLPMLRAMQGLPPTPAAARVAELGAPVRANGARAHYMRARLETVDGVARIYPFDRQDSALLSVLAEANALLIRPVNDPAQTIGAAVRYIPL
ncbi:MAG: molybdopterin molybdotransferase MoeA [Rhodobacteraceae bacterium]|nr:molybdopterin molybdotransferase MoeA [Paracoccaceae bacterium]